VTPRRRRRRDDDEPGGAPVPLADVLAARLDQLAGSDMVRACRAWNDVAGEAIRAAASPTSLSRGTLTVACASSVWAQELTLMAPEILDRMRDRDPSVEVQRLRFVTRSQDR
jgi:predicted nucleic acid-binding Zn ribbon protein